MAAPDAGSRAREFEAAVERNGIVQQLLGVEPSPIGYRNPQLTKLLEELRTTADPEAKDRAYHEISDLLRKDQPFAFLYRTAAAHIVHRRVKGLRGPWRANPLLVTEDLWLEDRSEQ